MVCPNDLLHGLLLIEDCDGFRAIASIRPKVKIESLICRVRQQSVKGDWDFREHPERYMELTMDAKLVIYLANYYGHYKAGKPWFDTICLLLGFFHAKDTDTTLTSFGVTEWDVQDCWRAKNSLILV